MKAIQVQSDQLIQFPAKYPNKFSKYGHSVFALTREWIIFWKESYQQLLNFDRMIFCNMSHSSQTIQTTLCCFNLKYLLKNMSLEKIFFCVLLCAKPVKDQPMTSYIVLASPLPASTPSQP